MRRIVVLSAIVGLGDNPFMIILPDRFSSCAVMRIKEDVATICKQLA